MLKRWLRRLLLAGLIWAIGRSNRLLRVNWHIVEQFQREGQPYLLAFWHNNILCAIHHLGGLGYPVLISRSRDGDDINWIAERFGFLGLRGSDAAGAAAAMRQALRHLKAGRAVIVTPDGPRGPRYTLKAGLVALARKSGVPIVPLVFSTARRWEFRSWDRMKLPKPFATVTVLLGDPIRLDPAGDAETQRAQVEAAMREAVRIAEEFTGAAERFPVA